MGAILVKADPRVQAQLMKMAAKTGGGRTEKKNSSPIPAPVVFSTDREILHWYSQMAAELGGTNTLLNEVAFGHDGSLMFITGALDQSISQAA